MERRKKTVDMEHLRNLLQLRITFTKISEELQISRPTLRRILREENWRYEHFASLTDQQLDEHVRKYKENHPAAGEVMVKGHLISKGFSVQRRRLRESLHRVDAEGIIQRRMITIRRRKYYVPSPNYVWHIDGTHKLIRWKFIVHVAIDGYSRLITYCRCADNNKAQTVLDNFKGAEEVYGLPLRIRTDFGVENVAVWNYMLQKRENSNAVIVGASVHNQRVERLNRDVNVQVVNIFYNQFFLLEDSGLLDPLNETDLYCLHLVYMPIINQRLQEFVQAHNNHSISTEGNRTPLQMYQLDYRLFHLQTLDESGAIDLDDIAARSENNVTLSIIPKTLPSQAENRLLEILGNAVYRNPTRLFREAVAFVANWMQHRRSEA